MTVSVIERAAATALTTPGNLRAELGLDEAAAPTAQVERFIKTASSRLANYCRRSFGIETVRQVLPVGFLCGREDGLYLERWPILEIVSVALDGVEYLDGSFEFDDRRLFLLRDGVRSVWSGRSVVVEYRAGWWLPSQTETKPPGAQDLDPDIESACIKMAALSIYGLGRDPSVRSESTDGVGTNTFYVQGADANLPSPEVAGMLSRYRVLAIA